MRARVATVIVATAMVGCSGGDDTGPGPSSDAVRLETGSAVTARLGREGGRLRATDASGRVYLLDIPALALRDSQNVTMTPVAGLDLPGGTSLVAAAHFAPEGLQLAVPARLAIVGPGGMSGIAAFGYSGDLDSLHLDLIGGHGDTVFVPVRHFSGAGVAATADVALLTPDLGAGAASGAWSDVIELLYAGNAAGQFDVQALASAMRSWADGIVIPALQGAGTDQQLLNAVARYTDWRTVVDCGASSTAPGCVTSDLYYWSEDVRLELAGQLIVTIAELELELAKALKAGIDRLNATCIANHDVQAAANSVYWSIVALPVSGLVPGLDAASFNDHFCLALKIESVAMPATLVAGTPAQLQVKAGLSFGGGAPDHGEPLAVSVSVGNAGNGTPASASGNTTDGTYTTTITPGGTSPLFLGIHVALTVGLLDLLQSMYVDTTYEQSYGHVSLTPSAAILDPGAQAQFTATVTGLGSTAVTWTATGGTLATAGNQTTYTAGGIAGTYAVTATSIADPTQGATATIAITSAPSPSRVVTVIPDSVIMQATEQNFFSSTVLPSTMNGVTWSATGGTITQTSPSSGGLYRAGAAPGTFVVTARSVDDPSAIGTAKVIIIAKVLDSYTGLYCNAPIDQPGCTPNQPVTAAVQGPIVLNGSIYVVFKWPVNSSCGELARLVSTSGGATLIGTDALFCNFGLSGDLNTEGSWTGTLSADMLTITDDEGLYGFSLTQDR